MGGIWLRSLPDVLRNAGLAYGLWPGWENRARSTGGYDRIMGVGIHHDAGAPGSSLDSRCRYAWENSPDRPIGAMWLHDDGFIMIGAAGATNTQGKGGPRQTSVGTIPLDAGNKYIISIEASNNGVGEVWTDIQQYNYVQLCAALCDAYGLVAGDAFSHFEWTDRKIDPAGNSWYASGGNKWDMDRFRSDVFRANKPTDPPIPPSGDDDDMRLYAATGPDGSVWVGNGVHRRGVASEKELDEMIYHSVHNQGPQIVNYCTGGVVQSKQEIWACKFAEWQLAELGDNVGPVD